MSVLVQKFGGTSVGTPERIDAVAERILAARRAGHHLVVVVSAMGETTDHLLVPIVVHWLYDAVALFLYRRRFRAERLSGEATQSVEHDEDRGPYG